jgi:hypothetical protein
VSNSVSHPPPSPQMFGLGILRERPGLSLTEVATLWGYSFKTNYRWASEASAQ